VKSTVDCIVCNELLAIGRKVVIDMWNVYSTVIVSKGVEVTAVI